MKIYLKTLIILFTYSILWANGDKKYSVSQQEQIYYLNQDEIYSYEKPKFYQPFARFGSNLWEFGKSSIQKDNWWNLGAITASTLLLVAYDQPMIDAAQQFGRNIELSGDNKLTTYLSFNDYPLFRGPTDLSSGLYYIGDGWTHISMAAGFLTYGLAFDDNRALQTAAQIGEGMMVSGFSTQLLKHITGRESPFKATADGGVWRPFADQVKYHKNVPKYDAFPSGHLCTAMMTVTVIAENYPEYDYIWPLGWTMMSLLSYQMLNNGVHWASDYPLAIGMGYSIGKIAVKKGRKNLATPHNEAKTIKKELWQNFSFTPQIQLDGTYKATLIYDMSGL